MDSVLDLVDIQSDIGDTLFDNLEFVDLDTIEVEEELVDVDSHGQFNIGEDVEKTD